MPTRTKHYCQSCGLQMNSHHPHGTNKDRTMSEEFCHFCFKEGHFLHPDVSVKEMQALVKQKLEEKGWPNLIRSIHIFHIPHLKRWNDNQVYQVFLHIYYTLVVFFNNLFLQKAWSKIKERKTSFRL